MAAKPRNWCSRRSARGTAELRTSSRPNRTRSAKPHCATINMTGKASDKANRSNLDDGVSNRCNSGDGCVRERRADRGRWKTAA
jgi:hypothetical protein